MNEYEYKRIAIVDSGVRLEDRNFRVLDEYLRDGWEYVDQINQFTSAHGCISVIVKKRKEHYL